MISHIFYHLSDHDGQCSAALAYFYIKANYNTEIKMYGIDHYGNFPYDQISRNDYVYMLDISFPINEMVKIKNSCLKFIWIDHHKNIIDQANNNQELKNIRGIRDISHSALYNAWKYFSENSFAINPTTEKPAPYFVELVSKYDIWQKDDAYEWENVILPFHYGLMSIDTEVSTLNNEILIENVGRIINYIVYSDKQKIYDELIVPGKSIYNYVMQDSKQKMKLYGYKSKFRDLNLYVCNIEGNSIKFSVLDQNGIDALIDYTYDGEKYIFSIYRSLTNSTIDVSEIARHFGGNGHPGAAGFSCDDIPFVKTGDVEFKKV